MLRIIRFAQIFRILNQMKHPWLLKNTRLVPIHREGHDNTMQPLTFQILQNVDVLPPMREPCKNNFKYKQMKHPCSIIRHTRG